MDNYSKLIKPQNSCEEVASIFKRPLCSLETTFTSESQIHNYRGALLGVAKQVKKNAQEE